MSGSGDDSGGTASTTRLASTRDGVTQLRRHWSARPARAALLIVHGIGEHSGRYERLGAHLAGLGFDVLGFDTRGFGSSGGTRAHVDRFERYLDDVEDLLAERRRLSVPVVLFGHSMGGLIAARYLVDGRPRPDLAVLSAPALAADVPAWQRVLAPVLGRLVPRLVLPTGIDPARLSRDRDVVDAYVGDPLVVGGATAGLGRALFDAMAVTVRNLEQLTVPTFVLHGSDDALVPPTASEHLERLPNVRRRVYQGLLHECLNEPEHPAVTADITAWLDEQLDALG
jgi:alpha-beta hydrolase superfamily lysophospholipase